MADELVRRGGSLAVSGEPLHPAKKGVKKAARKAAKKAGKIDDHGHGKDELRAFGHLGRVVVTRQLVSDKSWRRLLTR